MFITIKFMPESPEVDLNKIREGAGEIAPKYEAKILDRDEIEPVAFGLKALKITLKLDENKGSEEINDEMSQIEGVSSAEVIDMRREF